MDNNLRNALENLSISISGHNDVYNNRGILEFELEVYDDEVKTTFIYKCFMNEKHSSFTLNVEFDDLDVNDYDIDDIKEWLFLSNQKIKIGTLKLTEDFNKIIYSHSHYLAEIGEIHPAILWNTFVISEGMRRAYYKDFTNNFEL